MFIESTSRYKKLIIVSFCFILCVNVMRSQAYIPMLKYHGEWHGWGSDFRKANGPGHAQAKYKDDS